MTLVPDTLPFNAFRTRSRLPLAAFASAGIVLVLGVVVAVGINRTANRWKWVRHTDEVLARTSAVLQRMTEAESGQRGYLVTGDSSYLAPFYGAAHAVEMQIDTLRRLTADNRPQVERLNALDQLTRERMRLLAMRIGLRDRYGLDSVRASLSNGSGTTAMQRVREQASAIAADERGLLRLREAAEARDERLLYAALILGTLAAAMVALMLNTRFQREAERQRENGDAIEARNAQLEQQARTLQQQQASLEEQAVELELQSAQLQDQTAELADTNSELEASADSLLARTALAEEHRERAESANEAKTQFLSTMSHELRTPLNAITGYVDLLTLGVRGTVTDQQRDDLERIRRNGSHLLSLINDILNFAKLEAGELILQDERVDVAALLGRLEPVLGPQLAQQRVSFRFEAPDSRCLARGDRDRIHQALVNLVSNAMKFGEAGSEIVVSCRREGSMVLTDVCDTGIGIPSDKFDVIFEPFVQLDRDFARGSQQGVGLGLAISRDLVRRMGGDITVVSSRGSGSTFTMSLPAA